jgi:hypothetical protein
MMAEIPPRRHHNPGPALVLAAGIFMGSCATIPAPVADLPRNPEGFVLLAAGVEYREIRRDLPRPLRIHVLRADLRTGDLAIRAPLGPDPDGPGPAEAGLADPLRLARSYRALVLVNASSFGVIGYAEGARPPRYLRSMDVDIAGLAADAGRIASPSNPRYASFWVDVRGVPRIAGHGETPERDGGVREAAAGFSPLVRDGAATEDRSGDIEPRTAVGLDGRGRLVLVVAEGRRPGRSEGLILGELARLMLDLGCVEALNLDGGGSSVLVIRVPGGGYRVLTPPTDGAGPFRFRRPIPNALALVPAGD